MPRSLSLRLLSDRFDFSSELPAEANAGNRCYGRDLAEWLAGALSAAGLPADFLDEDWGWLVFARRGGALDFLVAVYDLADEEPAPPPGWHRWGLWVRAWERTRLLGLLPWRREVDVPARLSEALVGVLAAAGLEAEPWDAGPAGD